MAGGTARQIAWLGALVMVPSAGWLLRRRRGVLPVTALLWAGSVAWVLACLRWMARQPYSVPEPIFKDVGLGIVVSVLKEAYEFAGAGLCLLLLVSPILFAWLPEVRRLSRDDKARVAINVMWVGLFQWWTKWTVPWLHHVLNSEFPKARNGEMFSLEPLALPMWVKEGIGLLVVAAISTLVIRVRRMRARGEYGGMTEDSWQEVRWLLGPFAVSYFVMLAPRAHHGLIFDRYLLLVMPVAIVWLLRLYQGYVASALPAISVVVLAIFAAFGIAGTHDLFAWHRAQVAAIDEVRAAGVPRTEIQGGFEYDGWTQIEAAGYINDPRMRGPVGAYQANVEVPRVAEDCRFDFAPYTPAIHPRFTIAFGEKWCLRPSGFPAVTYRSWLPPYRGQVIVQEIPQ
jgi:hypothetical protein